jgi:hypothetical protein
MELFFNEHTNKHDIVYGQGYAPQEQSEIDIGPFIV